MLAVFLLQFLYVVLVLFSLECRFMMTCFGAFGGLCSANVDIPIFASLASFSYLIIHVPHKRKVVKLCCSCHFGVIPCNVGTVVLLLCINYMVSLYTELMILIVGAKDMPINTQYCSTFFGMAFETLNAGKRRTYPTLAYPYNLT